MSKKRFKRSSSRMLAGVCGGLADYLGVDPTWVRIGFALITLLSAAFPGLIVYLVCWVVVPE
ncbi:MAG: PspC domain-containing protein [Verrucomicrobiota bacterium]